MRNTDNNLWATFISISSNGNKQGHTFILGLLQQVKEKVENFLSRVKITSCGVHNQWDTACITWYPYKSTFFLQKLIILLFGAKYMVSWRPGIFLTLPQSIHNTGTEHAHSSKTLVHGGAVFEEQHYIISTILQIIHGTADHHSLVLLLLYCWSHWGVSL